MTGHQRNRAQKAPIHIAQHQQTSDGRGHYALPRKFDVGNSALSFLLQRWIPDTRARESAIVLLGAGVVLAFLTANHLMWAFGGALNLPAWEWQLLIAVVLAISLIGVKAEIRITVDQDSISIFSGKRKVVIPCREIQTVESITDLQFHRHYSRYADTQSFVNTVYATLILLNTKSGPVVLGIPPNRHTAFLRVFQVDDSASIPSRYGQAAAASA